MRGEVEKVRDFAVAGYYDYSWAIYTEDWSYIHWLTDENSAEVMRATFYSKSVPSDHLKAMGRKGFALDQDAMFVDLPRVDDVFTVDEGFGSVESIKSVNTLHMPVSGRVAAVNNQLEGNPGLVNADCYGKGWMIRISPVEVKDNLLLEAEAYRTALAH